MINWETIKSLYNDKPTLLQWLKKVEAALAGSVLQVVDVEKVSTSEIKLNFIFEDGTNIETPTIALPYEIQSVAIVNGHLILTLETGETLDAGNLGAVSGFSINAAQHLIVSYQDGTSQDLGAIFQGNVSINGNFTATGDVVSSNGSLNTTTNVLKGNQAANNFYSFDEDIQIYGLPQNLNCNYAHARVSNGKLSIVFLFMILGGDDLTAAQAPIEIGNLTIPQFVWNALVPYYLTSRLASDSKKFVETTPSNNSSGVINMQVNKTSPNGLTFFIMNEAISSQSQPRTARFEFNFML